MATMPKAVEYLGKVTMCHPQIVEAIVISEAIPRVHHGLALLTVHIALWLYAVAFKY